MDLESSWVMSVRLGTSINCRHLEAMSTRGETSLATRLHLRPTTRHGRDIPEILAVTLCLAEPFLQVRIDKRLRRQVVEIHPQGLCRLAYSLAAVRRDRSLDKR